MLQSFGNSRSRRSDPGIDAPIATTLLQPRSGTVTIVREMKSLTTGMSPAIEKSIKGTIQVLRWMCLHHLSLKTVEWLQNRDSGAKNRTKRFTDQQSNCIKKTHATPSDRDMNSLSLWLPFLPQEIRRLRAIVVVKGCRSTVGIRVEAANSTPSQPGMIAFLMFPNWGS